MLFNKVFKKVRVFAQGFGFLAMGLLMIYGAVNIVRSANTAYGAPALQGAVSGTVPPYLNYQGTLRDPEGKLMSGLHDMTFRLYDRISASQAEKVWIELHEDVTVRDGQFSVLLGNTTALPLTLFYGPDVFIGVTVAPFDEMVPRQRFASVPYAIYADHASALTSPDGEFDKVVAVTTEGRVGIGTESPGYLLDVDGRMRVREGDDSASGGIWFANGDGSTDYGFVGMQSPEYIGFRGNAGWGFVMNTLSGFVGIGTQTPTVPLHIKKDDPDVILDGTATGDGHTTIAFAENGTTGAVIDYVKSGDDLHFKTGANTTSMTLNGNEVGLTNLTASGFVAATGNLSAKGTLRLGPNLKHPVLIIRLSGLAHDYDDEIMVDGGFVSASEYDCVTSSWSVRMDVDEDDAGPYMMWTYVEGNNWKVRARFWTDSDETSDVDVLCFLRGVVSHFENSRTHESFRP